MSNALVEKLQKELQNASEKLKISSDTEEKTESINRELSSKLATLEMELQQTVEENKDLVNQLILLATVKEDLAKTQISLTYCMEEKRSLLLSIQSKNEASIQMENEIYSLKQSLQLIQSDMQTEKRMRKGLDDAVASLSAQFEEKECQLLSLYEGKMEVAQLQDMILELERTNIGYKDQLMKSEESRSSLESENSSLKVEVVDVRNQLAELLETSLASEIEVTVMQSHFCDRMQDSFAQLKTVERKLEEMTLKNADLIASLDTLAEKESLLIDKKGKLSIVLQSLQSDFDIIFREKESLIDYVNKKNAELEEVQLRAATVEADSNCHMKKYEGEICQLKNIMIFCEEEVCNLRSSRDALEITNVVLKSKLEEQHIKISLLEECESQLRALQEHNEEFSCRLSEQYESKIQELKNQSFVSKKYAEEMLLKLQNALDEVESRKKTEVSLVKKFEELSEKISNLECELVTVLTERKELANADDRITNELECTVLNLECCREKNVKLENSLKKCNAEKLKLEDSLKECNEEKNNVRVELDLVKRLFENLALDVSVNHEGNSDSDFPSITSIEQILQDDSFELSAVFQELPNYKDTNLGIDASTVDFTNSPKDTDVGDLLPTIADEKSCSYSPPNSTAFKDTESALGQQTKFTDNITDITDIEEHFKEQQKLINLQPLCINKVELGDHQCGTAVAAGRPLQVLQLEDWLEELCVEDLKEIPSIICEAGSPCDKRGMTCRKTIVEDVQVLCSFLKQHDNEALVFQSFRHINELIKEMLELKTRYTAFFDDPISLAIDAAVRLQPLCSEKSEKESGELSYTTRLLVSTLQIGCLIGKAGSIISEMRGTTRANICALSKDNVPNVSSEDDEMVQISGEIGVARDALVHVTTHLKANLFERDSTSAAHGSSAPHHRFPVDASDGPKYHGGRDNKSHGHGFSYSGGYGASRNLLPSDTYAGYGSSQGGGSNYSSYDGYSSRYGNIG
ncbi:hypothetical protein ZIOFF_045101 [Zingiber officinale]|uniref:K Homology domain-containing protein n=1 Tax=Zingiber officinale TaxID=94328 RepID=A0A8J5FZT1_ZINOF|nr:hypothetical protein ZIOFF_045101 [Zingiber officinale]